MGNQSSLLSRKILSVDDLVKLVFFKLFLHLNFSPKTSCWNLPFHVCCLHADNLLVKVMCRNLANIKFQVTEKKISITGNSICMGNHLFPLLLWSLPKHRKVEQSSWQTGQHSCAESCRRNQSSHRNFV